MFIPVMPGQNKSRYSQAKGEELIWQPCEILANMVRKFNVPNPFPRALPYTKEILLNLFHFPSPESFTILRFLNAVFF